MAKRIDPEALKEIFDRGDVYPDDNKILYDFCEMVFKSHFIHRENFREDLIQEGILGICSLVGEGTYDGESSVINFAYRRVRNVMTNYLHKEDRGYNEDNVSYNSDSILDSNVYVDGATQKLETFIIDKTEQLGLDSDYMYYVRAYFYDKIGIPYEKRGVQRFKADFVEKYRYYVNVVEFEMLDKHLGGRVFNNKVKDIIEVLRAKNEISEVAALFLETFSTKQLSMLLYVFSGNAIKIPNKYRLLKVDNYLSIFKRVMSGLPENTVSKMYGKSTLSVNSIYEQYKSIFEED